MPLQQTIAWRASLTASLGMKEWMVQERGPAWQMVGGVGLSWPAEVSTRNIPSFLFL